VARRLDAIYAQDFRRGRDGYRPAVGALDAGETLTSKRPFGRDAWVVEADLKQCFDSLEHDGMGRMLAERSEDGARLRWIRQWLEAGGLDPAGPVRPPVTGTPPGGTVSPVLAQVFLHSVLD